MTLRALVIGLGQIGMVSDLTLDPEFHVYSHARAFYLHPSFELVGGVDASAQRRDDFLHHFCVPAFENVSQAIEALSPDVVAIAVPTEAHFKVLETVLDSGHPRAILCEKPLSYDIDEARKIVALCEKANVLLYVNYVRRADLAVQEICRRLADGRIREPIKGVAWYSKGLFNNGSHFLDLLQYWLGELQSFDIVSAGRKWGEDPEPDFVATFAKGIIHFLAAREEDFSHYTVELVTSSGRLRYDLGGERVSWQGAVASASSPGYVVLNPDEERIPNGLTRIQWHLVDQLAAAISGEPAAICSGSEALQTIEHLTTIKNSL